MHAALGFTSSLISAAKRVPADLYVGYYADALPAAAIAARRHQACYAYDAGDFELGNLSDGPEDDLWRQLTERIERRWLPGCAFITAASPGIASAYETTYAVQQPTVVLNAFPRRQAPAGPTPNGSATPGPSIYWFSIDIAANRGLETAVLAIAQAASRPHLYVRGAAYEVFLRRLQQMACNAGVGHRLHILSPAPPADMAHLASAYDLGLSGEPGQTLNNQLTLGNKLFTYLLAGLPIVASDVPAHRQFAPELGAAMRLFKAGDAPSLAGAIDAYLTSGARLAAARATAFRLGQERFNWDIEKCALIACVDRALTDSGKALA
jgi:glycosyltransferase involved in cell wall biosynthesis